MNLCSYSFPSSLVDCSIHHLAGILPVSILPLNLDTLTIHTPHPFTFSSDPFPSTLRRLHLQHCTLFNHPIGAGQLPCAGTLKEIHFGAAFNQPLNPQWIPNSVNVLSFGTSFDQPIWLSAQSSPADAHSLLPRSLHVLAVGEHFCQPLRPLYLNHSCPQLSLIQVPRESKARFERERALALGLISSDHLHLTLQLVPGVPIVAEQQSICG